jgi:YVTN family beta-propeller protein
VLALVAISIPLLIDGDDVVDLTTNSVAQLDAESGAVVLASELGQRPGASAIGFGSVWVSEPDRGVIARLDLEDGSIRDTIRVGASPAGVAVGEGSVWVTNSRDGSVSRIDPETTEVTQTLDAGSGPSGIAVGDGVLWIADSVAAGLVRVDPSSEATTPIELTGRPSDVAFTPDGVWVSLSPGAVARVDPSTLNVTLTQGVGSGPTAVLHAFGSIWVANHIDGTVSRLDPSSGRVEATVSVGDGPNALAAAAGRLWVANEFDDSITAIDPASNAIDRTIRTGGASAELMAEGDALWLAVGVSAAEHRGGTLTVSSSFEAPRSLDPAIVGDLGNPFGLQILSVTNDGLLAYKKVGGVDGATLVPDLAAALPQVSTDGLT